MKEEPISHRKSHLRWLPPVGVQFQDVLHDMLSIGENDHCHPPDLHQLKLHRSTHVQVEVRPIQRKCAGQTVHPYQQGSPRRVKGRFFKHAARG